MSSKWHKALAAFLVFSNIALGFMLYEEHKKVINQGVDIQKLNEEIKKFKKNKSNLESQISDFQSKIDDLESRFSDVKYYQ